MINSSSSLTRTLLFLQIFDAYGEVSKIINKYDLYNDDLQTLYDLQDSLKNFWDIQSNMSMRNIMSLRTINENVELITSLYTKISKKPRLFETLDNNINRIIDLTNEINIIENHIKK